ncbi:hypothetical protein ALE3EI_1653 [Constantimarinum furrinae]|uniref:Uncharacterized protein n=1 Tax=Constantimarinum furrinae TaxID=2562285 RepID=A0A7G8PV39_9FLAO|nr:hypothetical protein ALE3EI_1653 [Constantimarinum furrinae]
MLTAPLAHNPPIIMYQLFFYGIKVLLIAIVIASLGSHILLEPLPAATLTKIYLIIPVLIVLSFIKVEERQKA